MGEIQDIHQSVLVIYGNCKEIKSLIVDNKSLNYKEKQLNNVKVSFAFYTGPIFTKLLKLLVSTP